MNTTIKSWYNYLNRPYPYSRKKWKPITIASLSVFFVLGVFQPFGLSSITSYKFLIILGFTTITAICTALNSYLFPLFFKKFYDQNNWTTGKSILNSLLIILSIALGNSLFHWYLSSFQQELIFTDLLLIYISATVLVGFIPMTVITFMLQNEKLQQNLREANELNAYLSTSAKRPIKTNTSPIMLLGTTKDFLSLIPEDILFLETSGNYIKIHYIDEEQTKVKQLRNTISRIEESLISFPNIIRCHRAFMVNISHILSVKGNSKGYHLSLNHTKEEIPVSRTYTDIIRKHITEFI